LSQAHASFQSDWNLVLGGVRLRVRAVEGDDARALPATVEPCVASRRLFTDNWWFDLSFALFLLP